MNRILLAAVSALPLFFSCRNANDVPDIIPVPLSVEMGRGYYTLPERVQVSCMDSSMFAIEDFLKLNLSCGQDIHEISMGTGGRGDIVCVFDESLDPSGAYVLEVGRGGIRITAGAYPGVVAAVATLGQMVKDCKVPHAKINDAPRFAWRGFMLDVARHFFTVDEVKAILTELARYKFNKFHWHLTDDQGWRIEIKAFPELALNGGFRDPLAHNHDIYTAARAEREKDPASLLPSDRMVIRDGKTLYGGYYTQDDIRDVVDFAASLGMDVIPEIDMPGHSLKTIESFPELSCSGKAVWGKDFSVPLCLGNDATLEFAKTVYGEIFGLFPYEYVHLGADEVEKSHWQSCPKCRARKAAYNLEDEHDLQDWFVSVMESYFKDNGKILIGWDEIAAKDDFSKDAVVQWWRPWAPANKRNAAVNGNGIILSPNEFYYMDIAQNRNTLMKVYTYEPVDGILEGYEDCVLGVHANLWTEYVTSFETACNMLFPRMFAVSETAWSSPEHKDAKDFTRRSLVHLGRLDACGLNYRIPDPDGFCDSNVYIDSLEVEVSVPLDGVIVRYTSDGSIPGPESPLCSGPVVVKEDCTLNFRPFTSAGIGGHTYSAVYRASEYILPAFAFDELPESAEKGLEVCRYDRKFQDCASITSAEPDAEYVSESVALPAEPESDFALVFRGYVSVPEDGIISFYTYTDDGSVMTVSGKPAVENDGLHSREEKSGQAALGKGWHPIEIRYFDHGGGYLEAGFILADGTRRPFTSSDLCFLKD